MTCTNCGTALAPGAGFCGACGRPVTQQPAGYAPPQPQFQQAQQPWQAQGYPPQQPQGYPPQQPQGYPPQQPQGYPPQQPQGYPPQQHQVQPWQSAPPQPQAPQPQGIGSMKPYPIVIHRGMTRLTGHIYVAPARLYFICESDKGGMGVALGKAVGGLIGGVIEGASSRTPGQGGQVADETELQRAAQERPGSLVMDPQRISGIKDTFWTHAIWFEGTTYALRSTLDKALKLELGQWCQAHGVKHAGLLPKK